MDENILNIVRSLIQYEIEGSNSFLQIKNHKRKSCPSVIPYDKEHAKYLGKILTEHELQSLIRALVKYSREAGSSKTGGSASPVVPLYWVYTKLYPDNKPELTKWVVDNTINTHYEPGPAYISSEDLNRQREEARLREEKELWPIRLARFKREAENTTLTLPNAIRRGDVKAVKSLIERGGDIKQVLTKIKSLRTLSKESTKEAMLNYLKSLGVGFVM